MSHDVTMEQVEKSGDLTGKVAQRALMFRGRLVAATDSIGITDLAHEALRSEDRSCRPVADKKPKYEKTRKIDEAEVQRLETWIETPT